MDYMRPGTMNFRLSRIGLRCGTKTKNSSSLFDEKQIIATVHKALDLGINFFDTADIYFDGEAEKILSKALGTSRKRIFIGTKVGLTYENKRYTINLKKDYIKKAVEKSLRRLRTDTIDFYQVHWPDANTSLSETFEALNECLEEEKIRYIGISNFNLNLLKQSTKFSLISSHMFPLNFLKREYEIQVIPYCYREKIAIFATNPLAFGLLKSENYLLKETGSEIDSETNGNSSQKSQALIERLKSFCAAHNRTINELAIAWVLAHTSVNTTICNALTPGELIEQTNAANWRLSQEELAQIELLINIE